MTTLLDAAQAVVNASKEYTPTWIHWAIKNRIDDLEQAIAHEQPNQCEPCGWRRAGMIEAGLVETQTASTNHVVSQKAAGTVDKDCGNCKKFSTNSLTGGPVCISCKDYSNWEPKP